ncbi:hypothetical protein [Leucobacter chromiireducens]|uniref:hypothetical protein n=1 Tax=Leucobacter chromiireducens TaxID=283877 RepID=UPI0019253015|nr:hypothetical protein [Leucobacter chromiireducens]
MTSHHLLSSRVHGVRTRRLARLAYEELQAETVAEAERAILEHAVARRELALLHARLRKIDGCRLEHTNELLKIELLSPVQPYFLLGGLGMLLGTIGAFSGLPQVVWLFAGCGALFAAMGFFQSRSQLQATVTASDRSIVKALLWATDTDLADSDLRARARKLVWGELEQVAGATVEKLPKLWELLVRKVRG